MVVTVTGVLVDPDRVLALSLVALVVIAVPGPSVLFVVSRGVALGRSAALATVLGNELGLLIQVITIAVGLGPLVEESIVVYTVIKLFGAAYLIYLGVQGYRRRGELVDQLNQLVAPMPACRVIGQGVVVGVSNPKGFLLFAAILPQFVDPALGHVRLQLFLLGMICVLIAAVSDTVWAVLASAARSWFGRSPRRLRAVGAGAGAVMVGLGVRLAVAGRPDR